MTTYRIENQRDTYTSLKEAHAQRQRQLQKRGGFVRVYGWAVKTGRIKKRRGA